MTEQLGLFGFSPAPAPALPRPAPSPPPSGVPCPESRACPCCAWPVLVDKTYDPDDALCWRCRDRDDPRLHRRARAARYGQPPSPCCQARARGEVRHDPNARAVATVVARHVPPTMRGRFGHVRLDPKTGRPLREP